MFGRTRFKCVRIRTAFCFFRRNGKAQVPPVAEARRRYPEAPTLQSNGSGHNGRPTRRNKKEGLIADTMDSPTSGARQYPTELRCEYLTRYGQGGKLQRWWQNPKFIWPRPQSMRDALPHAINPASGRMMAQHGALACAQPTRLYARRW